MNRLAASLLSVAISAVAHGQPAPPAPPDDDAAGETIEIFDERPDKPFDRDTEVRLTGEQLAARGATDLASALALIPDVTVRDAGRGGFNVDIRGARKGAVVVLIDGVSVADPWYGTFDVSTIPVTDIVQIRVATTPRSPIDGAGGPGGVIEVVTRDAIGDQLVSARLTADSLPSFGIAATARAALADHVALRLSASGQGGARDMTLPRNASDGEQRHAATGAGRLEYRRGDRRIALDGLLDDRHYVSPPSVDDPRAAILMIDRETSARGSIKADDKIGALQVQGAYYAAYLRRRSRMFQDPGFTNEVQREDLSAQRRGGSLLATRPITKSLRWAASASLARDEAEVSNQAGDRVRGAVTMLELAADLQYERARFRGDLALGLAAPFGVGADPWPEAKAVGAYKPAAGLALTATGAYKGRLPSLRERFDALNGNPALGPENVAHAELRAVATRGRLALELAPFYKRTTGTIRASLAAGDHGVLVNLGRVDLWGVDATARVALHAHLELGGSYGYIKANSDTTGDDPIDRLPRHRFAAWARGDLGARLSGIVRVHYFGASFDKGDRVAGYLLWDASLAVRLSRQYLAVLKIDDLLDEAPETRAGYRTPGRVCSIVAQGEW
jgi:outer membrane cobalamin receptor